MRIRILTLPGYGNEVAQVQTIALFDSKGNNLNFASKSNPWQFDLPPR
jgi:hypothetical protein